MAYAWATGAWATNAWAEGTWTQANLAPTITTIEAAGGAQNVGYSFQLSATGDVPITWDITVGALPTGLSLSAAGLISGTPTVLETQAFTVRATNAQGNNTKALSITIGTAATGTGTDRAARARQTGRGLLRLVGR